MGFKTKLKIRWYEQCGRCLWCGVLTWASGVTSKKEAYRIAGTMKGKFKSKKDLRNFQATAEHLLPKSKKGSNRIGNIVCACKRCNVFRGNDTLMLKPHPEVLALLPAGVQSSILSIAGKGKQNGKPRFIRRDRPETR